MPVPETVTSIPVRMAEYRVLQAEGVLLAVGLGSCVGVGLYDRTTRTAGLAHVFLPSNGRHPQAADSNPGKYADTAVPALLEEMLAMGARKNLITARIAGGSQLFRVPRGVAELNIGERNVEAVKRSLERLRIPLMAEDTGGNNGRTMRLYTDTGRIEISTVGKGLRQL